MRLPVRCPESSPPCLALCLCCGHCDSLEFGAHTAAMAASHSVTRWWTVACKASAVMRVVHRAQAALVLLSLLTELSSVCLTEAAGMLPVSVRSRRVRASIADSSVTALAPAAAVELCQLCCRLLSGS
jgi:hypothetical protein